MNNSDEVGKISYSVTIDVAALKAGTKSAEQAIKTSFGNGEKDMQKFASSADSSFSSVTKSLAVLTASFLSLSAISGVLGKSVDAANKFQSSMLGLESVAGAFTGETQGAMDAAKALSSDGLLPLADSATGLKNLLAAGYGLPEAITLMERFKESAAFGRQGSLGFGEAVRTATEGIKNGNSILVDNAGVTKNLSVILQEAGYSAQDLQHASTDVGVRMAILNGIVRETNAQVGDTAKLMDTAAGADARLAFATEQLQVKVGGLANILRSDAVNGLADFVTENDNAIIKVGAFTGGAVAAGVAMYGLSRAFAVTNLIVGAFRGLMIANAAAQAAFAAGNITAAASLLVVRAAAIRTIASLTIIGTIMAAVGFAAGEIIGNMAEESDKASESTDDFNKTMQDTSGYDSASKGAQDLAKKLRELDEQVTKVERDYTESLAKIVQDHQKSVKDLTKQIENENENYNAAVNKRLTAFQEEQGKEEIEHGKKVKNLQNQIDFLRKYQHSSNKQQLSDLQFSLAQENSQYTKRNSELKAKYDADAEAESLSHQQKLTENQAKLNEEMAFLNKHRDDVKSVRGFILNDEIESLKRSRSEQLTSLAQQRTDAINGNKSAGEAGGQAFSDAYTQKINDAINKAKADSLNNGIGSVPWIRQAQDNFANNWARNGGNFFKPMQDSLGNVWDLITGKKVIKDGRIVNVPGGGGGWATGGYTGAGGVNEVAGQVHRGEYVLPQSMVNQSTGLPKAEAIEAFAGNQSASSSNTYNITIPISGAIVTSPQDQRKFAEVIGKKINEVMQQKGFKPALEGM